MRIKSLELTWLFLLNFCVLQFFFFRLARVLESKDDWKTSIQKGWRFVACLPFTGWHIKHVPSFKEFVRTGKNYNEQQEEIKAK